MPAPDAPATAAGGFPLSIGLEVLVAERPWLDPGACPRPADQPFDADLLIVGSGYGAAVAARQLAGCIEPATGHPLRLLLLERGREYAAGSFPATGAELPGHVRITPLGAAAPKGRATGLFDLRLGRDQMALVANGLGGGSLINAGVMLEPDAGLWQRPGWPQALRAPEALAPHLAEVAGWLGARLADGRPNTVAEAGSPPRAKTALLQALGGQGAAPAATAVPITVALQPGTHSVAGVPLAACIGCGDCATGCNHGAKHSLDLGLLAQVAATPGTCLVQGATVLQLARLAGPEPGWRLQVQHTDTQLRRGQRQAFVLQARRVVLAAGTLGSTEILLRSQREGLALSPRLGERFSGNGDLIASLDHTGQTASAMADPAAAPAARGVGPTITAMVDLRQRHGFVLQDLAVPAPLARLFAEAFTTARVLQGLGKPDLDAHRATDDEPCAVQPDRLRRSLPLAMIGHDSADGRLRLADDPVLAARHAAAARDDCQGDGALVIDWPGVAEQRRWNARHAVVQALADAAPGVGGRLLANPGWQALAPEQHNGLGLPRGPLLTVHPLGGCVMADSPAEGVVDHLGRVFDGAAPPGRVFDDLVVLDGAIVPGSLGVNPALTIAALAHRAAGLLRDTVWQLGPPRPATRALGPRPPAAAMPPADQPPARSVPTTVVLLERLRGRVTLADGRPALLELTLESQRTVLQRLLRAAPRRHIRLDPRFCRLRLLPAEGGAPLLEAGLRGSLSLFARAPEDDPRWATRLALWAWLGNRGLRDIWQALPGALAGRAGQAARDALQGREPRGRGLLGRARDAHALASHARTVRQFEYRLVLHAPRGPWADRLGVAAPAQGPDAAQPQHAAAARPRDPAAMQLVARKRLHYGPAANPLRQLMEVQLQPPPWLAAGSPCLLHLDLDHLVHSQVPLLRVVRQQDKPSALADLASLGALVARQLAQGHLWSFRQPDPPAPRTPQRLPADLPGCPVRSRLVLEVDRQAGQASHLRLTHYAPQHPAPGLPPVLLIHGYSASGTSFAHPRVRPSLVEHLVRADRRSVWVLDMRSSCGMPTAGQDWAFETLGCEDIPLAVHSVCVASGAAQVDIVAHCMGAAMLFMGLLGRNSGDPAEPPLGRHEALRHLLWDREALCWDAAHGQARAAGPQDAVQPRIRRLVLSQVGPAMALAPLNAARAALLQYARALLDGLDYRFRPDADDPEGAGRQLLDRLLSALPYPPGEFRRELPPWAPWAPRGWVGTRHRIDALFGRVFNLPQMDDAVLDHIDDFFGPFSVATVAQVLNFARDGQITNRHGFNRFTVRRFMPERLRFPILSLHSRANGLVDGPGTLARLQALFTGNLGPGGSYRGRLLPGDNRGHQDVLIGSAVATQPMRAAVSAFFAVPEGALDAAFDTAIDAVLGPAGESQIGGLRDPLHDLSHDASHGSSRDSVPDTLPESPPDAGLAGARPAEGAA